MDKILFAILLLPALLLAGCVSSAPSGAATPTPTLQAAASATPVPTGEPTATAAPTIAATPEVPTATAQSGITMAQVAAHSSPFDCWVIVSGKVYDMSTYAPMHPGGEEKITAWCGKDATEAFNTRGGKGPHPQKALDVLAQYYKGDLAA